MRSRPSAAAQHLAGDDVPLDFAGALAYLAEFRVAEITLDRVLAREPVAAENLYRFARGSHRNFERAISTVILASVRFASWSGSVSPMMMLNCRYRSRAALLSPQWAYLIWILRS